jgi:subtilisin family serine protease
VIVAVLDTGVNYNHNDLVGNMWVHPDFPNHGYNTYNDNYNTMDGGGHGTHVAGTVAGTGKSGLKTGVAPDATIMAVKVLSSIGSGWEDRVWSGIEFAVENGAHVMNLSLSWRPGWNPDFAVWRTLMDNALAAGVIAAVAAGNSGSLNHPAAWRWEPRATCLHLGCIPTRPLPVGCRLWYPVGSTNYNDQLSSFSSKGPSSWQDIEPYFDYPYDPEMGLIRPDVVAPGLGYYEPGPRRPQRLYH